MPTVRVEGIDIHYELHGSGEPVVLIAGLGNDSRIWSYQVPVLAEGYAVLCFDNRGVGRSDKPEGPYSTRAMARDAAGLIDALGTGPAHVVGHSMGGLIAQYLAIDRPELVRSLTLAATYARGGNFGVQLGRVWRTIAETAGMEVLAREVLMWLFSRRFVDDCAREFKFIGAFVGGSLPPAHSYIAQNLACVEHDALGLIGGITAPCLLIAGDQDIVVTRRYLEVLRGNIAGSRLAVMEGAGHCMQFEAPERFNRLLLEFLEGLS